MRGGAADDSKAVGALEYEQLRDGSVAATFASGSSAALHLGLHANLMALGQPEDLATDINTKSATTYSLLLQLRVDALPSGEPLPFLSTGCGLHLALYPDGRIGPLNTDWLVTAANQPGAQSQPSQKQPQQPQPQPQQPQPQQPPQAQQQADHNSGAQLQANRWHMVALVVHPGRRQVISESGQSKDAADMEKVYALVYIDGALSTSMQIPHSKLAFTPKLATFTGASDGEHATVPKDSVSWNINLDSDRVEEDQDQEQEREHEQDQEQEDGDGRTPPGDLSLGNLGKIGFSMPGARRKERKHLTPSTSTAFRKFLIYYPSFLLSPLTIGPLPALSTKVTLSVRVVRFTSSILDADSLPQWSMNIFSPQAIELERAQNRRFDHRCLSKLFQAAPPLWQHPCFVSEFAEHHMKGSTTGLPSLAPVYLAALTFLVGKGSQECMAPFSASEADVIRKLIKVYQGGWNG